MMSLVEKRYRVRASRDQRSIAGLSVGGAETLRVAPRRVSFVFCKDGV